MATEAQRTPSKHVTWNLLKRRFGAIGKIVSRHSEFPGKELPYPFFMFVKPQVQSRLTCVMDAIP